MNAQLVFDAAARERSDEEQGVACRRNKTPCLVMMRLMRAIFRQSLNKNFVVQCKALCIWGSQRWFCQCWPKAWAYLSPRLLAGAASCAVAMQSRLLNLPEDLAQAREFLRCHSCNTTARGLCAKVQLCGPEPGAEKSHCSLLLLEFPMSERL